MNTGYLRHFENCNRHDLTTTVAMVVNGAVYGHVDRGMAGDIAAHIPDFRLADGKLILGDHLDSFEKRSEAFYAAAKFIAGKRRKKLRKEMYPLVQEWGDEPLAQIDRRAVPWFGCRAFGIHINGFVRKADGIHMWIGERAGSRGLDPGKLDNMVGGGQPIGLSIMQNVCKEAEEEAGIPPDIALNAKYVSSIRYQMSRPEGFRNDTLVIFDLELPDGYTPANTDGEVAAFHLIPIADVAKIVHDTNRFKFNCNLVVTDFLLRHGALENSPEHGELQKHIGDKIPLTLL